MRLPRVRFTVRQMMVAVAVLAPLMAASIWLIELGKPMEAFDGPAGTLARYRQIGIETSAGYDALQQGLFVESETRYRLALQLAEESEAKGDLGYGAVWAGDATVGLAEALAGQKRYSEAELLYKRAQSIQKKNFGQNHPALADVLDHYASFLRQTGRTAEMEKAQEQAEAIRESWAQQAPRTP